MARAVPTFCRNTRSSGLWTCWATVIRIRESRRKILGSVRKCWWSVPVYSQKGKAQTCLHLGALAASASSLLWHLMEVKTTKMPHRNLYSIQINIQEFTIFLPREFYCVSITVYISLSVDKATQHLHSGLCFTPLCFKVYFEKWSMRFSDATAKFWRKIKQVILLQIT